MGQHFLAHRELVHSTSVHHAVHAYLTNDSQTDLVIASPHHIRIYRVEPLHATRANEEILHLQASFPLSGAVQSLHVLSYDSVWLEKQQRRHRKRLAFKGGKDVLLLGVDGYKWVVVGFDRRDQKLQTLSMFAFNEEAMGPGATLKADKDGREQSLGISTLSAIRTDPQCRCSAMVMYGDQLVVVPFRTESRLLACFDDNDSDSEDEMEEENANGSGSPATTDEEDGDDTVANGVEEEEDDEEEKELEQLVHSNYKNQSYRGRDGMSKGQDANSRLRSLLDQSVKVGSKRKRKQQQHQDKDAHGLLASEVAGREFLLRLRAVGITGKVVDIAFLEGYLEPTLAILHEMQETSSTDGRFAAGYDTYCLSVLSINLQTRLHPIIWTVENLPSDSTQLFPCHKSLGGVLVLSTHALLYFNQTKYIGLAVSDFAQKTVNQSKFPLKAPHYFDEDGVIEMKLNVLLHNCCLDHVSDSEILLSFGEGEYFSLSFVGGREEMVLRKVEMQGRAIASCLTVDRKRGTVFVGSMCGDSTLYQYHANAIESDIATSQEDDDDEEDQLLYTASTSKSPVCPSRWYELHPVDALPGIGQITAMQVGVESSGETGDALEELVVSGGYLDQSSLSVLHHGLRPLVSTEQELTGCRAMWTVKSSVLSNGEEEGDETFDSYLILSVGQQTMVLRTSEDSMEPLEDSGFYTSGATLAASNLFGTDRIVQVFKQGVRLMMETKQEGKDEAQLVCTQELTLDGEIETGGMNVDTTNVGVVSVDVLDPYIVLMLTDGSIRVLMGDDDKELAVLDPDVYSKPFTNEGEKQSVSAACLFLDWAGMFQSNVQFESYDTPSIPLLSKKKAVPMCGLCFEDGSLHVYSLPDFERKGLFPYLTFAPQWLVNTSTSQAKPPKLGLNSCSVDNGAKKIGSINSPVADMLIQRVGPTEESHPNANIMSSMALIVFLANGDLLCYRTVPTYRRGSMSLVFQRVSTDVITRPLIPPKAKASMHHTDMATNQETNTVAVLQKLRAAFRYPMLTRFEDVNHASGAFFRGAHPMWILGDRGMPSFIPMSVAAHKEKSVGVPVLSFTPFHHANCPHGFIYFHSKGVLRVCELPSRRSTTILGAHGGFVLKKAPLGQTLHHLMYLGQKGPGGVAEALETPTYAVVCSHRLSPKAAEMTAEQEMEEEAEEGEVEDAETKEEARMNGLRGQIMAPTAELFPEFEDEEDLVHNSEEVYELRLVQKDEFGEWGRKGVFRIFFERYEVVLSVQVMYLLDSSLMRDEISSTSREYHARKRPYVVVGTGFVGPHGEDESGKGRLLLYEVDYAQYVNEEGSTSKKLPKLKLVYIKDHSQGAISSVAALGPYVLAAVGSKLIVYEFKSEQLVGCAFYDAQMFIVSSTVVKNFVQYGDVYKSVHFLRWKERERQLVLLAKDYERLAVTATEFSVSGSKLALLATDMQANLHVLQYAPQDIESRGGQRLIRTSDFHLGAQVAAMLRKKVDGDVSEHKGGSVYANLLASAEGSVSSVVPVGERVFRRLFTLQSVMITTLPQWGALNPREFRGVAPHHESRRHGGRPDAWTKYKWQKGFLEFRILVRFLHLDYVAQKEIARVIGTTPEVVVHNLLELQHYAMQFL